MVPIVSPDADGQLFFSRRRVLQLAALSTCFGLARGRAAFGFLSGENVIAGTPGLCIFNDRLYFNSDGSDHIYVPPRGVRSTDALAQLSVTELRMKLPYL